MVVTVLQNHRFSGGHRAPRQTVLCRVLLFFAIVFSVPRKSFLPLRPPSSKLSELSLPRFSKRDLPVLFRSFPHYHDYGSSKRLCHLLKSITSRQKPTRTPFVIILAVNYAYRYLAVNFVCNLIRLGVMDYLIFALDRPVFDFFVIHNINTFLYVEEGIALPEGHLSNIQEKEDVFGTRKFVETSRRKSVLVLKTLRLGFSVLFSDVDVVWLHNPIPELVKHSEDLVIQSDRSAADPNSPPNFCINSGFYFARSSLRTVDAFRAIVKYARTIKRSEQKAFNYVLCGAFKRHRAGPGSRVGARRCVYSPKGVTVLTLDAKSFPNGSDKRAWNTEGLFSRSYPRVIAIHANYVSGRSEKVRRIRRIGFWFHSEEASANDCTYPSYLDTRMLSF